MITRTGRRGIPVLIAALAVLALALAMAMLFSPVQAQEGSAPDKPTGLSATASHDSVTLNWDDPGDDSITGYVILRRVRVNNTGGKFSELVPDTGTAATTYTDDSVQANTTYTYRIKANQRARGERALPLVPHRHTGGPRAARQAHGPLRHGDPRPGGPHLGRPGRRQHHRIRHP